MKKKLFIILTLLLSVSLFSISKPQLLRAANIDPSFRFTTIETEHFDIHYHQGLREIAGRAALISEDVHEKLTSSFKWSPEGKTQIVLLDNTDFANGYATVLPYNAIYIFVVPPLAGTTLGEYDDWLELVITHEYAHIVTMDPVRGFSSASRKIFGKPLPGFDPLSVFLFLFTSPPNVLMPDWWLEGIATWAETEFTSAGRGRSSFVEMIFRMSVLEDAIPRIDRLNGDVPYWPSGRISYLYGMLLNKHIAEKKGNETTGELNMIHAGRFPFFINEPPRRLTGLNYVGLYHEMVNGLKSEQRKKVEHLKSQPLTLFDRMPLSGEVLTNPRVSPDGRYLAFNRRDPHQHEEIVIFDKSASREIDTIRRFPSDHKMSWSPDSQTLYFTQADAKGSYNLYQDIFRYDLASGSVSRLTKDARAKEIDVSPDGKSIVFVKVKSGRQDIAVLSIGDRSERVITGDEGSALSGPKWSPDGRSIVYSKNDSGQTSLEILNVETGSVETLIRDDNYNIDPAWSPDGNHIIFSSDRTGIYNLFAYSPSEKKLFQVTHLLGGAFQPEMSGKNGKVVFSGYNSKGFFIAETPYDSSAWSAGTGPEIKTTWNETTGNGQASQKEDSPESAAVLEEKKYRPSKTILPRFWLPTLNFDHDGGVFGAFTAGQDVLGYHSYLLQGEYGVSGEEYYNVSYLYNRWNPSFFLNAYSKPFFYSELFNDDDDYYERRSGITASINVHLGLGTLESRYNLFAGYNYAKVEELTDIENRRVDGLEVYEGRRDSAFAGFRYSGALKYPYSISREDGRNITLMYRHYLDVGENDLNQREYTLDYDEFIGLPKNHAIYFNLKGATSDGDLIAQQAYQVGGIPAFGNPYSVRGFSSGFETGRHIVKSTLEYRFPIMYIFKGRNTKPFFLDRLHLAVYSDAGNVWGSTKDEFDLNDTLVSVGLEVRLDLVLGYKLKITPAIGIAQGLTEDGETQPYITIYGEL
ncbi:MAG: peptidase S9 [Nitrospirota bacterium]